jgi:hypothetical protein
VVCSKGVTTTYFVVNTVKGGPTADELQPQDEVVSGREFAKVPV